jgi:hypothetical protein
MQFVGPNFVYDINKVGLVITNNCSKCHKHMYYCQHEIAYCNNLTFVKVICHQIMNKTKHVLHWDFFIEFIYIYINYHTFARGSFMSKDPNYLENSKFCTQRIGHLFTQNPTSTKKL